MTFSRTQLDAAESLLLAARDKGAKLAAAESCTGGLVSALLTEIPGSSDVVAGGFVTYSNAAKTALLSVPDGLLASRGAVSEPVARAMAESAREALGADAAIAITGIAGPGGGSEDKPVGLVHFACATSARTDHMEKQFGDLGRTPVRMASVDQALSMLDAAIGRL